jgi:6-phosphogluconolactonase
VITRRRLLQIAPAFALLPSLAVDSEAQQQFAQRFFRDRRKTPLPPELLVYIGCDTAAGIAKGIYVSRLNHATGHLTQPMVAAETFRPAFMAAGPERAGKQFLYATNEGTDATSAISSFLIDRATGGLHQIGKVSAGFGGPCYISVDATGRSAFVADYAGGGIASYKILPNGTLSEPVDRIDFRAAKFGNDGPVKSRQDGPHPHSATISPDNRFLVVNDLGKDAISVFSIDAETAHLGPPQTFTNHRPGSGPRHVAFHPNGQWVYGICELDSTIDQYLWNELHGAAPTAYLTYTGQTVSSVSPDFHPTAETGVNTAAEIAVSPSGYYLHVSNRGENSLALFAIDQTTGALTFKQRVSCGGKTPRQFTLDPSDKWLLCGNQGSGSVTVFSRNEGDGRMTGPVQTLNVDAPMFVMVV